MAITLTYLNSLGLMALVSLAYGAVLRSMVPTTAKDIFFGVMFGIAAAAAMFSPIQVSSGVFTDARNVFVAFSAVYAGSIPFLICLAVAVATRATIGGVGVLAGVFSMLLAGGMSFWWAHHARRRAFPAWLVLLGLGTSIATSIVGVIALPPDVQSRFLVGTGPSSIVFNLSACVLFGIFLKRERRLASFETRLLAEALSDPLTSVFNRRGLERAVADRIGTTGQVGVLVLDLDHFKALNDRFGHQVGDQVLKEVACRLLKAVEATDIVSRLGGEEFVIVLVDAASDDVQTAAERIRRRVEDINLPSAEGPVSVTASIGTHWTDAPFDLLEMVRHADQALYLAKRKGRNRIEHFIARTS